MIEKARRNSYFASLRRQYRDTKGFISSPSARFKYGPSPLTAEKIRLYGIHAVNAALQNPNRVLECLYATPNALKRLNIVESNPPCLLELCSPKKLDTLIGSDAVHQGVVLETKPLKSRHLSELTHTDLVVVMDQITDPHNVGAIMRSAVAFKAGALITTHRHSPQESGVLAKAASGALEMIDYITVRNLAEALKELHKADFISFGLDSEGGKPLEIALTGQKIALILGAEGKGLRKKTRETVCALARLDMPGNIKSLNVSNAATIALYATHKYLRP
ncbi:RNA methyltransferase, TrmH family, group 3 [Bartonella bacilliformis str. Heidi Mejia]|uniref:RNA methyltransferase, TrmH family n=2 Tax=Bartonella bacilliformis TaxID=774 RepID=A1USB9_BARBK|nr:RNA methyltransferase [Bartonella bacilliformis]ABM45187.1 RNA methyltransferase, TrmH family [Bartonella bacilliformis KC583]AMG85696.1 RNA methyltransferase [Bartonella bacilliformis]EKS44793.1 tRNA /rRNA methyltransferase [Bartonella bacilliformis INS]EYS90004.1 RNA methyltransferase, TrmH family, group 3 [Bartonella bacilliformis San Pedro600-02]EYS92165.1 RNA methyltransferase, TrmH family, group 3 [Bartonella bacilliformis str. Heidi Mejia]